MSFRSPSSLFFDLSSFVLFFLAFCEIPLYLLESRHKFGVIGGESFFQFAICIRIVSGHDQEGSFKRRLTILDAAMSEPNASISLLDLPNELLESILLHLHPLSVATCRSVSTRVHYCDQLTDTVTTDSIDLQMSKRTY